MRRRRLCHSSTRVTASLLLGFLAATSSASQIPILPPPPATPNTPQDASVRDFSLKHIFHHGTYKHPDLHRRLDVPENAPIWMAADDEHSTEREAVPPLRIKSEPMSIERLVDRSKEAIDGILEWGRMKGRAVQLAAEDWTVDEIPGPNVTDKDTVLTFARMASNAYILEPNTGEWQDVEGGYNYTEDFGWESDGLRGHIFADSKNSTVVIGLKGTSPAVFDGSETTTNDKVNDNLFFSCCCGQGGQYLWRQVCDCQTSAYTCNSTCLVTALRDKNRYYYAARDLYHNVSELYPGAEIWMAGHSLGGAVSSFLGLTYGHPALTFEAVPEAMPASRLGLPTPPGHQVGALHQKRKNTGGFHFGHTADPVYMGQCNTASSSCTFGGYAMQSVCHTGYKCAYDTVEDFGWRVGIGTHKIVNVIKDVLEKYDKPAKCSQYVNCTDCFPWEFFESNGTEPSSTITTTKIPTSTDFSRTRTETCKTPGWWGCLDEPETTTITTTTTSTSKSSSSTSSCKTPGWFGCKDRNDEDPSSTTSHTTTKQGKHASTPFPAPAPSLTSSSPIPTSSCRHPGWFGFGCDDEFWDPEPTSTPIPIPTTSRSSKSKGGTSKTKTKCEHPGFFGFCDDDLYDGTTTSTTTTRTGAGTTRSQTSTSCSVEGFFGLICLDGRKVSAPTERVEVKR